MTRRKTKNRVHRSLVDVHGKCMNCTVVSIMLLFFICIKFDNKHLVNVIGLLVLCVAVILKPDTGT